MTELIGFHHAPQPNHGHLFVGYLDAHDALARDGRLDANRRGGQRQGEVVAQRGDLGHLNLHAPRFTVTILPLNISGLEPELGDHWPGIDLHNGYRYPEARQCLFDDARLFANVTQAHRRFVIERQHLLNRRQIPSPLFIRLDLRDLTLRSRCGRRPSRARDRPRSVGRHSAWRCRGGRAHLNPGLRRTRCSRRDACRRCARRAPRGSCFALGSSALIRGGRAGAGHRPGMCPF